MTTNKKTELPKFPKKLFKGLHEKVSDKSVELGDELRDNLALDSIAKAEIIRGLRGFQNYFLELVEEAEKKHQKWRVEVTQQIQGDINVMTDEYFAEQKVRDIKVDLDEARKKNSNFVDGFIRGFQEGYLYKAKQVLGALDP